MRRFAALLLVPAFAICFAGCWMFHSNGPEASVDGIPPTVEYSLADLLKTSRADLARQTKELEEKIDKQLDGFKQGQLDFALLPTARVSRDAPVFQDASYNDRLGFSLPSYVKGQDNVVALHLAQYGDVEAARKLTSDHATLAQIDALQFERNYPVEWTRLVGLLQIEARIRLASNDVTGAADIAQIHLQLRELLDEDAAKGPLGAVLLGGGRKTLEEAAVAWRAGKNEERAAQADAYVAAWGDVPGWTWPLPMAANGAELARLLLGSERGHIVVPDKAARLLDICGLPLPREGIDDAFLCLDSSEHFREAVVIYQPRTTGIYHSSLENLGVHLEDSGAASQSGEERWCRRRTYETTLGQADFMLPLTGDYLGAVVRFQNSSAAKDLSLTRDFVHVHLDRSFENNRWRLDPRALLEPTKTEDSARLSDLMNPVRSWKPCSATLVRDRDLDVLARLEISYLMDVTKQPFSKVIEEAWESWGPARIAEERGTSPTFSLLWEDKDTRYTLRFPLDVTLTKTEFIAEDRSGVDHAQRALQVADWDRKERLTHLQTGHLSHRVPRKIEFDGIELGMKTSKAIDMFARAEHYHVRKFGDVAMITFDGAAPENVPFVARQAFLCSDAAGMLAEIRVRYQDAADGTPTPQWSAALLDAWKARCGAPVVMPPTWASLWPEYLTARPVMFRWLDEQSALTFQADDKGVEIVLRACPVDKPEGVTLPPLKYLPRGPEGYELGMARKAVPTDVPLRELSTAEDVTITPKAGGLYDQIQFSFDQDHKLVRIAARHADKDLHAYTQDEQTDILRDIWARRLKDLGWTRRQDLSAHKSYESLGWQDDCTRLRTYWTKSDGQQRLFTEWKDLAAR